MNITENGYSIKIQPTLVDFDNNIIREYPEQHNLITDWGLNHLNNCIAGDLIKYISIGTGLENTNRGSGTVTFTQVGDVITASETGFFDELDGINNRTIQLSNNTSKRIKLWLNETQVQVYDLIEFTNCTAIIWNTERNLLVNHLHQSSTLNHEVLDSGGEPLDPHGTFMDGAFDPITNEPCYDVSIWRTVQFDFPTTEPLITEAGWSDQSTNNSPLFGRVLLETPIQIVAGTRLLIKVTLLRRFYNQHWVVCPIQQISPSELKSIEAIERLPANISYINDSGTTVGVKGGGSLVCLEPSRRLRLLFVDVNNGSYMSDIITASSYVTDSFEFNYFFSNTSWDLPTLSNIRFLPSDVYPTPSVDTYVDYVMDGTLDLNINRKIDLWFTISWNRILPVFPV